MSGNMKKCIKFLMNRIEIFMFIGFVILVILIFLQNIKWICVVLILEVLMFLLKINLLVRRKLQESVNFFNAKSKVRNIDCLIIGDMAVVDDFYEEYKQVVQLYAPNRTLNASYEILKHTYSIVKENGKVIIAYKMKNKDRNNYSVFDIPYFHNVTINRLHIHNVKWKKYFPLCFDFCGSIGFLLNKRKLYKNKILEKDEIYDFCLKRGLELEYRYTEK